MSDILKSILTGIVATPLILMFILGIGLASGLNPHFLLVSVLITNSIGLLMNRKSSDFFNIGVSLVVLLFVYQESIGIESGYLQTFIIFAIPAIIFTILSWLPINYSLVPNRAIAPLIFGIGVIVIIKQLPNAFAYTPSEIDFSFTEEEKSFFATSTIHNWIQLALALSIPIIALIGLRCKKGSVALLLATFVSICIGYWLGYDTEIVQLKSLTFKESFQLDWTFSPDILLISISNGITVAIVMLVSFWGDFSILNYDQRENKNSIKKSLRVVGIGNLISGLFGVMPANISFIDSFSIRAFGKTTWISKLPVIIILLIIAIVDIPDFSIPMYAFAGMLIYIGILMVIKSWKILKDLHPIDYIFTILIGLAIVLFDYTTGFILAIGYALIFHLITRQKEKHHVSKTPDQKE